MCNKVNICQAKSGSVNISMKYNANLSRFDNPEYVSQVKELVSNILHKHSIDHVFVSGPNYWCPAIDLDVLPKNTLVVAFFLEFIGPTRAERISKLAQLVTDNPVLVLVGSQGVEKDWPNMPPNVFYLQASTLFAEAPYKNVMPQREKNPNMETFWIGLCNSPHAHKILTACCLLGHDLGLAYEPMAKTGLLRISNYPIANTTLEQYLTTCKDMDFSWVDFDWNTLHQDQKNIYQKGFDLLSQCANGGHPGGSDYAQFHQNYIRVDNAANFQTHLTKLYNNTLVELVIETTFTNHAIFITEKFKNSVYGFNLPIIFSSAGSVAYLRNIGFDMCDDVIDHSYDLVQDPLQRIFVAVKSNIKLLSDKQYAWQAWTNSLSRLERNYELAKNKLDDYCLDQIRKQLPDLIQNKLRPVWCPR